MKYYYLHVDSAKANHAGSKAVSDCENIMANLGYKKIKISSSKFKKIRFIAKIEKAMQLLILSYLPKNSVLVIRHPIYIRRNYFKILRKLHKKNIKLVFLIHDLESLRQLLPNSHLFEKRDYEMYKIADYIIAHNNKMKEYLIDKCGVSENKIIELGVFDYLVNNTKECINTGNSKDNYKDNIELIVAGNLSYEKSGYVYNLASVLPDNMSLNLYGVNFDEKRSRSTSNCKYMGTFDADELPDIISGSYGIVWDGPSVDRCEGNTGNYLKYNNPHKVSLYIAAGIPIIIWNQAAMADFVKENKIGIAVESLSEIPFRLSRITYDEYAEFKKNIMNLSKKIKSGYFLTNALKVIDFNKATNG